MAIHSDPQAALSAVMPAPDKPRLDRVALSEVVELALWVGELLMERGAETQRVEEAVRSIGIGLGCDWGNVVITHGAIIVTYFGGGDFRTKVRSVRTGGVDMALIEAVSHLCHRVDEGKLGASQVRAELQAIQHAGRRYTEWQTVFAAGLGCAAFSRLFGGDWPAFGATLAASSAAMFLRTILMRRGYAYLIVASLTALAAGCTVGWLRVGKTPEAALAASVVLLVPGPASINAVEDLIKGHVVVGLARAAFAVLVIVFATIGLVVAMQLTAAGL